MLLMFASTEGMKAWKSNNDGSCMDHNIMEVLKPKLQTKEHSPINLLHVLTEVNNKMSEICIQRKTGDLKTSTYKASHFLTSTYAIHSLQKHGSFISIMYLIIY